MNRERFLDITGRLQERYEPPCWLVPGARVLCGTDHRVYVVWRWRRSCTCRSGICVVLQRTEPPLFRCGKEVDLGWLDPVVPPVWVGPDPAWAPGMANQSNETKVVTERSVETTPGNPGTVTQTERSTELSTENPETPKGAPTPGHGIQEREAAPQAPNQPLQTGNGGTPTGPAGGK